MSAGTLAETGLSAFEKIPKLREIQDEWTRIEWREIVANLRSRSGYRLEYQCRGGTSESTPSIQRETPLCYTGREGKKERRDILIGEGL